MYRKYISIISGLLFVPLAWGQVSLPTSDLLELGGVGPESAIGRRGAQAERVELIVRYASPEALDGIRACGGEVVSLVGTRTAIVSVAPAAAAEMLQTTGVTGARLSRKVRKANDKGLPASNVQEAREFLDGLLLDGEGVVVGIFDSGIDPNHINFRNADGTPRIKTLWHYPTPSAHPDVYDTPVGIGGFTTDNTSESHGTHTLGIMAGSFRDATSGAPDYRGVACGAEILAGAGDGYNGQILDALERIGAYAQQEGKPCVINLSFGDNVGPHDGSDEFTEAINDIAAKYDAVVCMSAGNERDEAISLVKALPDGNPEIKTLLVKGSEELGGNFQVYGPVEIWTEDGTPFEVTLDVVSRTAPDTPLCTLEVPDKKETYLVQGTAINQYLSNTGKMYLISSGTQFQDLYVNSYMGGLRGVDPYNGRYCARLNFLIEGRTSSAVSRNFVKVTVKGEPGQKIFMYCDGWYMNFGSRNIPGLETPDGNGTNSNMASGPETFAVGSYVTANRPGSGYPDGKVGEISFFSSWGETPAGRDMPDLCTPGQVIISSRNSYMPQTGVYLDYYPVEYSYTDTGRRKTWYWTDCAGTSQASPHGAGIFALWRQAAPDLDHDQLREIARESAANPNSDEQGWGAGKMDALAGLRLIKGYSGVLPEALAGEQFALCRAADSLRVLSQGDSTFRVTVTAVDGSTVYTAATGCGETAIPRHALPSGLLVVTATGESGTQSFKIFN